MKGVEVCLCWSSGWQRYDQSLPAATMSTIRVSPCKSSSSNVERTVESRSNTPMVRGSPWMETVRGMTISDFVSPSQAAVSDIHANGEIWSSSQLDPKNDHQSQLTNMARVLLHIRHDDALLRDESICANAFPSFWRYAHASWPTVEWAERELVG